MIEAVSFSLKERVGVFVDVVGIARVLPLQLW